MEFSFVRIMFQKAISLVSHTNRARCYLHVRQEVKERLEKTRSPYSSNTLAKDAVITIIDRNLLLAFENAIRLARPRLALNAAWPR